MTTSRDVRDMLGIDPTASQAPRPKKKVKTSLAAKRASGISREVLALQGDNAPPIPLQEPEVYKAKRKRPPPTHITTWPKVSFVNQARQDGLTLKHWFPIREPIRAVGDPEQLPDAEQEDKDAQVKDKNNELKSSKVQTSEYPFAKHNVQIERLQYTDELYKLRLKTDEWSREETDYLVDLYADCYGKWPVVWDRYDFQPVKQEDQEAKHRTMEDLKARYYDIWAKVMAASVPLEQMNATEFSNHEKLLKFNPEQERNRKRQAAALLQRSMDEKREEEHLLAELRRIYARQERFVAELKDVRERLDHGLTREVPDAQPFTTSAEINNLFQKFVANNKANKPKRPSLTIGESAAHTSSPANNGPQSATTPAATAVGNKRASLTNSVSQQQQNHRKLTPQQEARFGVSSHERLTSGVTFRSDKLQKARQAKSQAQTQKIATVLTELGVPDLLQMPTRAVCEAMERLVGKVNLLLDLRKNIERADNELKIEKEKKTLREKKQSGGSDDEGEKADVANNGSNIELAKDGHTKKGEASERQDDAPEEETQGDDYEANKRDSEEDEADDSAENEDEEDDAAEADDDEEIDENGNNFEVEADTGDQSEVQEDDDEDEDELVAENDREIEAEDDDEEGEDEEEEEEEEEAEDEQDEDAEDELGNSTVLANGEDFEEEDDVNVDVNEDADAEEDLADGEEDDEGEETANYDVDEDEKAEGDEGDEGEDAEEENNEAQNDELEPGSETLIPVKNMLLPSAPATRTRNKRSASVISASSMGSGSVASRRSKRGRKA